ncbi:kinetochore-associated protein 1-like [Dendronephthya gigantea]|uniref:kinetochore-associated protein 1-like n=1 Tax=Dendronephthya gigantea TaxID=151771 RepID=UPI00106CFFC7|nr:kinetochore-associated protein 1-like [Dendronephthya gigantea]
MPWKVAEVETQEEEATVNLLRREQSGALYKVDELARITSDEKVDFRPLVTSSAVSAGGISLSLFNEIFIFHGEHSNFISTVSFESNVDTMAWCPDSEFLVICDSSGTIHFFSITLGDIVFTSNLVEVSEEKLHCDSYFSHSMFASSQERDGVNLTILSHDCCVFSFKDLPLRELSKALESNDLASIGKLKEDIQMEILKVSDVHDNTGYFVQTPGLKSSLILSGAGRAAISMWSDQSLVDIIEANFLDGAFVKKCDVSLDGKYILILDGESNLTMWDTNALIMLSVPCHAIKDFILTSSSATFETGTTTSDSGQVITLSETVDGEGKMQIYQLPNFEEIFSKEVAKSCSLAKSNLQEKVNYTEEYVGDASNNNIQGLAFKCLSESSPEHRVYNLIRKKKFDAALEFSNVFGLDVEFVYKAKASTILADIPTKISESDSNAKDKLLSVDQLIDDLEETLQNVRSIEFCVECCLTASPPQLRQVHRLLCFAKDKISKDFGKSKNKHSKEMNNVLFSIHRLETFRMVFGDSKFSGHKWQLFSTGCMFSKVTQALSEGKLSNAAVIWVRHHTEFESAFSCEKLQKLLASVRSDLPSSSIVSWMKSYLVPFIICSVSDRKALFVLASWLEQRVISLEIAEKENWPNNGLEMATLLFDVVSKCIDENSNYMNVPTPVIVSQDYGSALVHVSLKDKESNPLSSLALLVEHLTELKKLHINYHCKLPLAEFTKETPTGIMFKMLDCVLALTLIPNVINNQIAQYGVQHGFQIDDVLLKYISYKTKQVYSSISSNSYYEDRFVEITRCIRTRAKRLEAILMLMSWASVPWRRTIEEMVRKAMNDDPSNSSLQMSYRLMEIKKILSHYNIRDIELSSDLHLKNVLKYMLGTSHETALQDALRIVETYHCMCEEDIYVIRLRNLCLRGLPNECVQLLVDVDDSKVMSVANYFLTWVLLVVDVYADDVDDRSERKLVIQAGIQTLEFLQNIGELTDETKVTLSTLKSILALEKEFSIFVTYQNYSDAETSNEILSAHLKKSNIPIQSFVGIQEGALDKLSRLASLFGFSLLQLQNKIMLQYISDDSNCLESFTMSICNAWLNLNMYELSSEDVFALCMSFLKQQVTDGKDIFSSTDFNVPAMTYMLACRAATNCESIYLNDYLELCRVCWLSNMLYVSCESGDFSLSTSTCGEDLLLLWNTASRFRDNGFVLDINSAFPLYNTFVKSVLLAVNSPAEHLESLGVACRDLVVHLEENNLHELALHYALCSLRHLLVFASRDEIALSTVNEDEKQTPRIALLHQMGVHGVQHVSSMLLNLVSKVMHDSSIDYSVALGYISSVSEDAALQKLKIDFAVDEGHDPSQAIAAFNVFLGYAKCFCDEKMVNAVEELYSDALWHTKLQKLGITCEKLLIGETKEVRKVLELLLEKPAIDVAIIVEFCKCFSIDINDTLHTYVKFNLAGSCLLGDTAALSVPSDSSSAIIKFQDNLVRALDYMSKQSSVSELLALLKDILISLPLYDYERVLIVLDEIIKLSSNEDQEIFRRQLEVLNILANYTRIAVPSEYEEHYQAKELSFGAKEHPVLPKSLAEKRLPFHPLFSGKPWKIIAPELNDCTITKLLRLCQILKMQEDQAYVVAANNLVSSCLREKPADEGASDNPCSSIYFEKAASLLSAVRNPELAVKTGLTLLSRWPQSEERVKAASALVELVQQWKSNCQGEELQLAEKVLKTTKDLCQEIVIQHILHSNGVTDESSFNLKRKPVKLIFHLYETYGCVPDETRPNVHKIAEEVAAASDLNITKVRNRLLMEWQPSSSSRGIRSAENSTVEKHVKDRDNLKRVVYLMQADSIQKNALFLLNFAYRQGPSKITYESRVKAMKLLFNIASQEIIESVASGSIDELKNYMKSLVYLSELAHLHLNQTVESFQRCNKEGLVKGLWKNHKDNAHAILLIADICLDSKISDPHIWTNILRQLFHLGLITYLSNLLPRLTQFPNLWQASNLLKVWTDLAIQTLEKAVHPLSPEEVEFCQRSMQLLQKCPIMTEVITLSLFNKLLELRLHSYALACLTLLQPNVIFPSLTKLMSVTTPKEILDVISKERSLGQCYVNPDAVESLVFDFFYASDSYKDLQDSEHYFKFADYLIRKSKFSAMVMTLVKNYELKAAIELALHYDRHAFPLKNERPHFDVKPPVAGLEDLVAFLKKFALLNEAAPYLPDFERLAVVEDEKPKLASDSCNIAEDEFFDVF